MKREYADLHLHTKYSDGFSSPEEVVKRAKNLNFKCIAITDHDSITGIEAALEAGEKHGVEVIPSVEISATEGHEDIHILGYFINWQDEGLKKTILDIQNSRKERMFEMIDRLKKFGVYVDEERFVEFCGHGFMGRLKLAHYLVKEGWVSSVYEAFDKFIGNNKPAYKEIDALSFKEAIEIILGARGIPVLAHPGLNKKDYLISDMVKLGLRGLEVFSFSHTPDVTDHYLKLAKEYKLLITGGSDCHGNSEAGLLIGQIRLPMIFVEKLKQEAMRMKR